MRRCADRGGLLNEWDRLPGESGIWYGRFDLYRLLGTGRSLDATYRTLRQAQRPAGGQAQRPAGEKAQRPAGEPAEPGRAGASWWANAEKWEWQRRAEAWDVVERDLLRAAEEERRRDARERRLYLLGEVRESSWKALLAANLSELSEEEARGMLGSLRLLFMESLKGERLEMGEPTEIVAEGDVVSFRADELARAENELAEWRARRESNG